MKTFFKFFNRQMNSPFLGKGVRRNRRGVWGKLPRGMLCRTPSWKEGELQTDTRGLRNEHQSFCHCGPRAAIGFRTKPGMTIKTTLWRTKPAMTKVLVLLSLIITIPAFATDPDPAAQKTVASKAYVDTKQDEIPATEDDYYSVLTDGDTDGEIGKMQIVTSGFLYDQGLTLEETGDDTSIPTASAVFYELDNYWQPKITSGNVLFYDGDGTENDLYVPSLVVYDSTTQTLEGNQIGILDYATMLELEGDLSLFTGSYYNTENSVPTVRAVAEALNAKQSNLSEKSTGDAAPKGNQAVVLNAAGNPSWVYTTAGKDLALTAKSGAQRVMNYVDGTTASAMFATSQGLTEAQVKSALVSLELLKDVYSALHTEIQNSAPTGTANTLANYDSTGALGSGIAVASAASYDSTTGALENGSAIPNITALETKQNKMTCAGYESGHENDPEYCWLWNLNN